LTNIASGTTEQTQAVVDSGAAAILVELLEDQNEELVDQCVWALGNIAGDSEKMRDIIINAGGNTIVINIIQNLINAGSNIKLLRNATWFLSNLNRGRSPPPPLQHMISSLSVFNNLVFFVDPDIVNDSFWALSYICDADISMADMVIQSNALRRGLYLLNELIRKLSGEEVKDDSAKIGQYSISPIIRMVGNIVTGTDEQTSTIIEMGFLDVFKTLFYSYDDYRKMARIRKEICWTISNIAAGTIEQIQSIFDSGIIPLLVDALRHSELYVRSEACWAVTNAMSYCDVNYSHFTTLMSSDLIDALRDYLEAVSNMPDVQAQILDGLSKALKSGKIWASKKGTENIAVEKMEECGIVGIIEDLQDGTDRKVADKAYQIIYEYFE
jgi:hypothetical protein